MTKVSKTVSVPKYIKIISGWELATRGSRIFLKSMVEILKSPTSNRKLERTRESYSDVEPHN